MTVINRISRQMVMVSQWEGRGYKSPVVSFKHRSLTLVIIYEVHVQTHSLNDFPFALLQTGFGRREKLDVVELRYLSKKYIHTSLSFQYNGFKSMFNSKRYTSLPVRFYCDSCFDRSKNEISTNGNAIASDMCSFFDRSKQSCSNKKTVFLPIHFENDLGGVESSLTFSAHFYCKN